MKNLRINFMDKRKEVTSVQSNSIHYQRKEWAKATIKLSIATGNDDDDDNGTNSRRTADIVALEKMFQLKDQEQLNAYNNTFGDDNRLDNIDKIERMAEQASESIVSMYNDFYKK